MSYTSPSAEVAEDFAQALDALNLNNRYEISNLTVIAKENTEHAFAISEALKNHIKQVGAIIFYDMFSVLESLVKILHACFGSCIALGSSKPN
jgi:pre-mRNA cleavage complex 2 protein Pcf11